MSTSNMFSGRNNQYFLVEKSTLSGALIGLVYICIMNAYTCTEILMRFLMQKRAFVVQDLDETLSYAKCIF